jgi:rRNA maturation protein Rpf1
MKNMRNTLYLIMMFFNSLTAQEDPFIGYFEQKNEYFSIELSKTKEKNYTGFFYFQGLKSTFSGSKVLGMVVGNLMIEGKNIPFSLARIQSEYYFTLDGVSTVMEKINRPDPPLGSENKIRAENTSSQVMKKEQNLVDSFWDEKLSGKQILYLYTHNGFSDKTLINLFKDKTFEGTIESVSVSQIGSGTTRNSSTGTWKISRLKDIPWLVLTHKGGAIESFQIETRTAKNEINLNEKRFFIKDIN